MNRNKLWACKEAPDGYAQSQQEATDFLNFFNSLQPEATTSEKEASRDEAFKEKVARCAKSRKPLEPGAGAAGREVARHETPGDDGSTFKR